MGIAVLIAILFTLDSEGAKSFVISVLQIAFFLFCVGFFFMPLKIIRAKTIIFLKVKEIK